MSAPWWHLEYSQPLLVTSGTYSLQSLSVLSRFKTEIDANATTLLAMWPSQRAVGPTYAPMSRTTLPRTTSQPRYGDPCFSSESVMKKDEERSALARHARLPRESAPAFIDCATKQTVVVMKIQTSHSTFKAMGFMVFLSELRPDGTCSKPWIRSGTVWDQKTNHDYSLQLWELLGYTVQTMLCDAQNWAAPTQDGAFILSA
eukprot:898068-Amphidinium_carterae.1